MYKTSETIDNWNKSIIKISLYNEYTFNTKNIFYRPSVKLSDNTATSGLRFQTDITRSLNTDNV